MLTLTINGEDRQFDVPGDMPLLWVLRDVAGLTGTKFAAEWRSAAPAPFTSTGSPYGRA
jgi:isoquinoline 1-oxidoreductase subunit alpha